MRDFTLKIYGDLLIAFRHAGYEFITFEEYCIGTRKGKFLVLRHDVDLKAENSLETAKIEAKLGIKASYYFRWIPESNKPNIIKEIVKLGHEVGYHYEDMTVYSGDKEKALMHFKKWLMYFRKYYDVKTICMHGSL